MDWQGQKSFPIHCQPKPSKKPFMLIKTRVDWLLRPFNPQRSKLNRSFRNRANCSDQIFAPQNQQLWDLGIPEQSMESQENEKAKLEVGPIYHKKSFNVISFLVRCWKTNSILFFWPSSLMRALWFLQSISVGIWSRLRFSLGQKTGGVDHRWDIWSRIQEWRMLWAKWPWKLGWTWR